MDIEVTNNQLENRFEIVVEGHLALLEYRQSGDIMTLIHTEVPNALGGKGLGGKLVKYALDYAKKKNLNVVAYCEFAKSYIQRHN